jgi:hypothetical protein
MLTENFTLDIYPPQIQKRVGEPIQSFDDTPFSQDHALGSVVQVDLPLMAGASFTLAGCPPQSAEANQTINE